MPCLLALLAFFFPRVVIVLVVIFSDYIGAAYKTVLWPLLGFLFMPYTTLAYAWAINANGSVSGLYLIVVILAVLLDLGVLGGGARTKQARVVTTRTTSGRKRVTNVRR
jgi:hypothetical protein